MSGLQRGTHLPARHDWLHVTPHAPQLALSVCRSTHAPPHAVWEGEQTHALFRQ